MDLSGSLEVGASRARAWSLIVDPERVGGCGPGVESVERLDPTHFRARAKVGIGIISTRFEVDLELLEADEPSRAVIAARGHAPGSDVEATGEMRLSGPPEGPTRMDWRATIEMTGAVASLGARLVQGMAEKLAAEAFDCIKSTLEAGA